MEGTRRNTNRKDENIEGKKEQKDKRVAGKKEGKAIIVINQIQHHKMQTKETSRKISPKKIYSGSESKKFAKCFTPNSIPLVENTTKCWFRYRIGILA